MGFVDFLIISRIFWLLFWMLCLYEEGIFVSEMIFTGGCQDFAFVCTTFCSPFVKCQAWSRSICDWRIRRECQLKLDLCCWSTMCYSVITVKSSQALFDFLLFSLVSCFLSWSSTCCCGYCCFCDFPLKSVSTVIFFFTQLSLILYGCCWWCCFSLSLSFTTRTGWGREERVYRSKSCCKRMTGERLTKGETRVDRREEGGRENEK